MALGQPALLPAVLPEKDTVDAQQRKQEEENEFVHGICFKNTVKIARKVRRKSATGMNRHKMRIN
jgi:hypothetical protein